MPARNRTLTHFSELSKSYRVMNVNLHCAGQLASPSWEAVRIFDILLQRTRC